MFTTFSEAALRGVDMSETLRLYHSKDDQYKGIIYDQSYNLVVQNFPVPKEFVFPQQRAEFLAAYASDSFPLTVYEAVEGTLIRVYRHAEQWQISTSSRIDAFSSTWASPQSFGEQFAEWVESISGVPLDVFLCSLRLDRTYFFLLPTSGLNRLGKLPTTEHQTREIFLVAIETDTHELLVGPQLPQDEVNLWSRTREWTVATLDEFADLAERYNLMYYRSTTELVKCMTTEYARRCALRGNQVNILYRYLELYKSEAFDDCDALRSMFPEVDFETLLFDKTDRAVRLIHQAYLNRYIHKQVIHLPKALYILIRKCHARYKATGDKTTYVTVREIFLAQHPRHILQFLADVQ
jgi:hypothetical protein